MAVQVSFSAKGMESLADHVVDSVGGLIEWQRESIRDLIKGRWEEARRLDSLQQGDVCEYKGRRFIVVKSEFAGDVVVEFEDGGKRTYAAGALKLEDTVYLGRGKVVRKIELDKPNEPGV